MLIDRQRRFAFLHIPKTAGMSVTNALGMRHRPTDHDLKGLETVEDYFRFCFVRDPFSRFVSAYRYSVMMAHSGHASGHRLRRTILDRELDQRLGDFVDDLVVNEPVAMLASIHFRPQVTWIQAGRPTFIGRVETIDRDLAWIAQILGFDIPAPEVINRSDDDAVDLTLTAAQRQLVENLYGDDYLMLGYPRSSTRRAVSDRHTSGSVDH